MLIPETLHSVLEKWICLSLCSREYEFLEGIRNFLFNSQLPVLVAVTK